MNDKEKLIKGIKGMIVEKTIIPASLASTDKHEDGVYDQLVRDIVAVFEKAHTPTDAHEALIARAQKNAEAMLGGDPAGYDGETELGKLLLDLASALERPVSTDEWAHCSPTLLAHGLDCASTHRRACACEPTNGGHDHIRPQGEPSDAQVLDEPSAQELLDYIFDPEEDDMSGSIRYGLIFEMLTDLRAKRAAGVGGAR